MSISADAAVMRAVDSPLQIETVQVEPPRPGEVLVRLRASGLCHSDLRVLEGSWAAPLPLILGHEGAGVIERVGPGVEDLVEGDHVVLCWTPPCGMCRYCAAGRPTLCDQAKTRASRHVMPDGSTRVSKDGTPVHSYIALGTFGSHAVVPRQAAVKVPREVPFDVASLMGCAVMTGFGAVVNTAAVPAGSSVLVIGCGGVGLNVVQAARVAGAGHIVAVDRSRSRLDSARTFGATATVDATTGDVGAQLDALDHGAGFDFVFEAAGSTATAELAISSTGKGGTVVLVGQTPSGQRASIDPLMISDREVVIRGSNYGSARPIVDFPRIARLYLEGVLKLDSMVSDAIALSQINEGFDRMRTQEGIRTVIAYDD